MSLLDSVTSVIQEIGVPAPTSLIVAGVPTTVPAALQMLGVANRAIKRITDQYPWSALIVDYDFTFTNGDAFYAAPADYGKPLNQTQWDISLRRPLNGPINPQDWQFFKVYGVSGGVWPRFRIKGNQIQIDPVPVTGSLDDATVSYISKYGVVLDTPFGGFDNGRTFRDDADGFFCDADLFELEFKWRYLRVKGLDYAEEMNDAQMGLAEAFTTDGSKTVIDSGDPDLRGVANTIPGNITGPFP